MEGLCSLIRGKSSSYTSPLPSHETTHPSAATFPCYRFLSAVASNHSNGYPLGEVNEDVSRFSFAANVEEFREKWRGDVARDNWSRYLDCLESALS